MRMSSRTVVPDRCIECDKSLRPGGQPSRTAPGTVRHASGGRCATCCARSARRAAGVHARKARPERCVGCGVGMRAPSVKPIDAPGTRTSSARGLCSTCFVRERKYGLTMPEWHALLIEQRGRCASCDYPMTGRQDPHTDHNHSTGRVRALLCQGCNTAEGLLLGDPARARSLAAYMERHASEPT